jgi:septal ring-binding cell division protein DamX
MDEVAPANDMTAAIATQAVELATDTSTEVAERSSLRTTEETVIASASAPAPEEAETSTTVADETLPAGAELLQQRLLAARTWLSSTDRSHFTIQLLATDASQGASLEEFLRSWRAIGRLDRIYVYRTKIRGGVWFGVLYDDFKTFSGAREALDRLPPEIKRYKPFIRNVRDIGNLG